MRGGSGTIVPGAAGRFDLAISGGCAGVAVEVEGG